MLDKINPSAKPAFEANPSIQVPTQQNSTLRLAGISRDPSLKWLGDHSPTALGIFQQSSSVQEALAQAKQLSKPHSEIPAAFRLAILLHPTALALLSPFLLMGCYTGTPDFYQQPDDPSREDYDNFTEQYEAPCARAVKYIDIQNGCGVARHRSAVVNGSENAELFVPTFEQYQENHEVYDELADEKRCLVDCEWEAQETSPGSPDPNNPINSEADCKTRLTTSQSGYAIYEAENLTEPQVADNLCELDV